MKPDCEVKFLLQPADVLGSDRRLSSRVRAAFELPSAVTRMNVQFLDTDSRELYRNGWCPRIRKTEGEAGFELTYKKRYPLTDGDIDDALSRAERDGFDASATGYAAQIEWGYQKQTLSISRAKRASSAGRSGMDLPGASASRAMLIADAPGRFDDGVGKHWGTGALADARIYGPVLARRSVGSWGGVKIYVEVWPIRTAAGDGTEDIVEASFKARSHDDAARDRDSLAAYLQREGWLLAQDSLKTKIIMDRY